MRFGLFSSIKLVGPVGGAAVTGLALALLHAARLAALSLQRDHHIQYTSPFGSHYFCPQNGLVFTF